MVSLFTTIVVLTIQWRPRNRFHFQHREFSNIKSYRNNLTFHYAGFSTSHHQNSVTLNSIILVRVTMHERRGAFYYSRPTGQRLVGIPDNLWFMAEGFSWRTAINNSRNIFFWHFFLVLPTKWKRCWEMHNFFCGCSSFVIFKILAQPIFDNMCAFYGVVK